MYLVHVDSTIRPPSPLVDLRGLFVNPLPPSGPHGLRMTPNKACLTTYLHIYIVL